MHIHMYAHTHTPVALHHCRQRRLGFESQDAHLVDNNISMLEKVALHLTISRAQLLKKIMTHSEQLAPLCVQSNVQVSGSACHCMYVYVCMYVRVCLCVCMYTLAHTHMHTRASLCPEQCPGLRIGVSLDVCVYVCMYVYTRTHTYAYINTYTHKQMLGSKTHLGASRAAARYTHIHTCTHT